jgi:hypothetical protein
LGILIYYYEKYEKFLQPQYPVRPQSDPVPGTV